MTDTLVAFLRARLDHEASDLDGYDGSYNDDDGCWGQHVDPDVARAEVEAKREVVRLSERAHDYHETFMNGFAAAMEHVLRLFALPYADHPDYKQEWRP